MGRNTLVASRSPEDVTESGRPAGEVKGIQFVRMEPSRKMKKGPSRAIFNIPPGKYELRSRLN